MKNTLCGLLLAGLCGLTVNTHAAGLGDALRGQIGARAALAPRPWAARSAAVPTCRPWG